MKKDYDSTKIYRKTQKKGASQTYDTPSIQDDYIEKYLAEKKLNLTATLDSKSAYADADFAVIAAPSLVVR